ALVVVIIGTGAVAEQYGELVIITLNMRDGYVICRGKGNPEWNYSGPHGAGRLMRRTEAKKNVKLAEFEDAMKDVWSTSVTNATIDESPFAYKPMDDIVKHIGETVDIIRTIKPIYNFKAK